MKSLACFAVLAVASSTTICHEPPTSEPTPEHRWLQQLVGEWNLTCNMTMTPGQPPERMEGTEKARAIGDLWVLGEGSMTFGGKPQTSLLTLGYDPQKKAFVGTWVDTLQTTLWIYRGSLDADKKVLTLEADGPSATDPTKTATYRDAIEIKGPDHKRLTSSVRGEDGSWTTFLTADYRRKK